MRARVAAILLLSLPAVAAAQNAPDAFQWTAGAYVGTSQHAAAGHLWGLTKDREHYFVGIHADVPMVERSRWTFSWAPELTPLLVVTKNPFYRLVRSPDTQRYAWIEDGRGPVVGFGMAPIGLEADIELKPGVQPYAAGALGCLWFTRDTPSVYSRKFNFTAEFGGGIRIRIDDRAWMLIGYKFHHFSNAHTAPSNPGVDAHVVFIGFDRIVTHRRRSRVGHP
jgi:hypothetical protein